MGGLHLRPGAHETLQPLLWVNAAKGEHDPIGRICTRSIAMWLWQSDAILYDGHRLGQAVSANIFVFLAARCMVTSRAANRWPLEEVPEQHLLHARKSQRSASQHTTRRHDERRSSARG